MDGFLAWMEGSEIARFVLENSWVFPTLETLHFMGLILLIGSLFVFDLRVLGLAANVPIRAFVTFIPVSLAGFAINVVTGVLFLFSDPPHYYYDLAFRLKMLAVLLAGLNVIWFKFAAAPELAGNGSGKIGWDAKVSAGLSMLLWTTVIVLGRMIPYLE